MKKELSHPKAPLVVRNWVSAPPDWVDVRETASTPAYLAGLDDGEADSRYISALLSIEAAR